MNRWIACLAFAVPLALPVAGCTVHAQTEPVGYTEVTSEPVDIEASPYVVYEGRRTYWVRDHWVYREGPRWVTYRQEPPELYRQRAYVQHAPPARHYAPPSHYEAPPAHRVE